VGPVLNPRKKHENRKEREPDPVGESRASAWVKEVGGEEGMNKKEGSGRF